MKTSIMKTIIGASIFALVSGVSMAQAQEVDDEQIIDDRREEMRDNSRRTKRRSQRPP